MTRKTKRLVVIYVPALVSVLIIGGLLALVLTAGGSRAGGAPGYEMAQADTSEGAMPGVAMGSPDEAGAETEDAAPAPEAGPPCVYDHFTGHPVDETVLKETGRPYRLLPPGTGATRDFNPARINLETDDEGIVLRVWCG